MIVNNDNFLYTHGSMELKPHHYSFIGNLDIFLNDILPSRRIGTLAIESYKSIKFQLVVIRGLGLYSIGFSLTPGL